MTSVWHNTARRVDHLTTAGHSCMCVFVGSLSSVSLYSVCPLVISSHCHKGECHYIVTLFSVTTLSYSLISLHYHIT